MFQRSKIIRWIWNLTQPIIVDARCERVSTFENNFANLKPSPTSRWIRTLWKCYDFENNFVILKPNRPIPTQLNLTIHIEKWSEKIRDRCDCEYNCNRENRNSICTLWFVKCSYKCDRIVLLLGFWRIRGNKSAKKESALCDDDLTRENILQHYSNHKARFKCRIKAELCSSNSLNSDRIFSIQITSKITQFPNL